MSLIRNRRDFLSALFSALLALALFDPGAAAAQEVKQIKLTEKHIQGFMAASKDMARLYDGADPDKPDPKVEAQAGVVAKKNGFASLAQYEDVSSPSRPNRSRMRSLRSRPTNPSRRRKRKRVWRSSRRALKIVRPIQFKENIALVLKYFDKLAP